METRVYTIAERPDLRSAGDSLNPLAWPEFMMNDPVGDLYFGRLWKDFPQFQFVICDENDMPIANGNMIPFFWDGSLEGLPSGWDAVLEQGFKEREAGITPNTLSALSATIHPDYQGKGLSQLILKKMRSIAGEQGFGSLVAPVRPSMKAKYPLTSIERYAAWALDDGAPFDPWLRTHWRLGARIIKLAPESMVIPAKVALWEEWAGMRFPESGTYVVPGALTPVEVDVEADRALYIEPNVWMRHPVGE